MMNKLKFLLLLIAIFFIESIVLSFFVSPLISLLGGTINSIISGMFILPFVFMLYKVILELWAVYLLALMLSSKEKVFTKEIFIRARKTPILLILVFLALIATDADSDFLIFPTLYIPSVLIAYLIVKNKLPKYLNWVNKENIK